VVSEQTKVFDDCPRFALAFRQCAMQSINNRLAWTRSIIVEGLRTRSEQRKATEMENGFLRLSNGPGSPEGSLPTHLSNLVAGWTAQFNALLVKGVEGTIQFARAVHADKARLPYGHWSAIWKSSQVSSVVFHN